MASWLREYRGLKIVVAIVLGMTSVVPSSVRSQDMTLSLEKAELTESLARVLGEFGRPTIVTAPMRATLEALVTELCGNVPSLFWLAVKIANEDETLSSDTVFDPGKELKIPPCPPVATFPLIEKTFMSGDRLWDFYKATSPDLPMGYTGAIKPLSDELSRARLVELVGRSGATNGNHEFVNISLVQKRDAAEPAADDSPASPYVNITEEAKISFDPAFDVLPAISLNSTKNNTYADIVRALNPDLKSLDSIPADRTVILPGAQLGGFSFPVKSDADLEAVAEAAQADSNVQSAAGIAKFVMFYDVPNADCKTSKELVSAQDVKDIIRLLAENRAGVLRLRGGLGGNVSKVAVLDTGVFRPDLLPGSPKLTSSWETQLPILQPTPAQATSFPKWQAFRYMPKAVHGTNAIVLAGGGRLLPPLLPALDLSLQLNPVRILESQVISAYNNGIPVVVDGKLATSDSYHVDGTAIANFVDRAENTIISMSFGTQNEISAIEEIRSKSESSVLIVAAAGNDGQYLDSTELYPVKYGGGGAVNIITVASVDGDGAISTFSNWGSDYIDIGAPGCRVPTLSYDFEADVLTARSMTGTSASAPQIAWLAAAVRWFMPEEPVGRIRARILAGADHNPALTGKIQEGRVANAIKTLSLTRDVLETRDASGNRRIVRGSLSLPKRPSDFCSNAPEIESMILLKLVAHFNGSSEAQDSARLYWLDGGNRVKAFTCSYKTFSLQIRDAETDEVVEINSDQIVDITFSWL